MSDNDNSAVLILGGGIAGIEAALNLAEFGIKVYLLESTPSIGGLMARLNKTFPTNDCSICIEAPKMYDIQRNPNIVLMSNTELRRVNMNKISVLPKFQNKQQAAKALDRIRESLRKGSDQ